MKQVIRGTVWLLLFLAAMMTARSVEAAKTPPYVVAVQDTGASSPYHAAVDPVRGLAYIGDSLQSTVWVMEGKQLTATVAVAAPFAIGIDPGRYAYVTTQGGTSLTVIEGTAKAGTVDVGALSGAVDVFTPTQTAYVALPYADRVALVQGTTLLGTVAVGDGPRAVLAVPQRGEVYVANGNEGTVSVLQGATLVATITVGTSPSALTYDPVSDHLYVANAGDDTLTVISGHSVIATLNVGVAPSSLAVNGRKGYVYLGNAGSPTDPGSVQVISDTTILATLAITAPQAIAVNPQSGYAYVAAGLDEEGRVGIISYTTMIETFLPVGHSPRDVAVDPVSDLAYVPLYKAGSGDNDGRIVILGRTEADYAELEPGTATVLDCDLARLRIEIPAGAVDENTTLLCTNWEPTPPEGYLFLGRGFILKAYRLGIHQPGLAFLKPVTLTLSYDEADFPVSEEKARLYTGYIGGVWDENGLTFITQDEAADLITETLSHLPQLSQAGYALLAEAPHVYLPLVLKQQ